MKATQRAANGAANKVVRTSKRRKPKTMLSDWILVRTAPRRERWAMRNIEAHGKRAFLPAIQHEGKSKVEPMFPGYLFVEARAGEWYYLKGTFGVASVVMDGDRPARVPIAVMRMLKGVTDAEGIMVVLNERFTVGQRVKIQTGPFRDIIGVYIRSPGPQRVAVLLQLMQQDVELVTEAANVTGVLGY